MPSSSTWGCRASSSWSRRSTCACRCAGCRSPARAPSPPPCAASCATPPPAPRRCRCCSAASGDRPVTLPEPRVGRPLVMGVVNVTPDSFSDGGAWFTPEAAVAHGRELVAQGADLLDVGGESTRPGAERPSTAEELRRVLPVVEALSTLAPVSVDTMRADVAAAALDAGAALVNDVSGGLADPEMVPMVAQRAVPFVAMHWRGHSRDMQQRAQYDDVVADVVRELAERVEALT